MPATPPAARPASRPDWDRIDTVLLDMDGVILDLAFDNRFWLQVIPAAFGAANRMSTEQARAHLQPWFSETAGTLDWYCLDHWTRKLGLDVTALKQAERHHVRYLDGARAALPRIRQRAGRLTLATNAHRGVLAVKQDVTGLCDHFDTAISSHDYGAPKEAQAFWVALHKAQGFDPACTLFVDDSPAVREAARVFGVGQVWGISRPDSTQPEREISDGPYARRLADLLP